MLNCLSSLGEDVFSEYSQEEAMISYALWYTDGQLTDPGYSPHAIGVLCVLPAETSIGRSVPQDIIHSGECDLPLWWYGRPLQRSLQTSLLGETVRLHQSDTIGRISKALCRS